MSALIFYIIFIFTILYLIFMCNLFLINLKNDFNLIRFVKGVTRPQILGCRELTLLQKQTVSFGPGSVSGEVKIMVRDTVRVVLRS